MERELERVYLDWNATTPPHPEVVAAMGEALASAWANPASVHGPGRRARDLVDRAREAVAALAGTSPRDVILTSGGTEANNMALAHAFPEALGGEARPGGNGALVLARLEHPSVLRAAEWLAGRGVAVVFAAVDASGVATERAFEVAIEEAQRCAPIRLVALQAVNHETGVVQPVEAVARLARQAGARLHVDAVQAAGKLDPGAFRGADTLALAAHKIRGPKGVGALATRPGVRLSPLLRGGAQERGLRPGTQDPAACAGFAAAARRALEGPGRWAGLLASRDAMEARLLELGARAGARPVRNGDGPRAPHVSNLSFPGWRGDELAAALDLEGVAISSGPACSAGTSEPSPGLEAAFGRARARSAVRISLGEETTEAEIERALAAFERVLGRGSARR